MPVRNKLCHSCWQPASKDHVCESRLPSHIDNRHLVNIKDSKLTHNQRKIKAYLIDYLPVYDEIEQVKLICEEITSLVSEARKLDTVAGELCSGIEKIPREEVYSGQDEVIKGKETLDAKKLEFNTRYTQSRPVKYSENKKRKWRLLEYVDGEIILLGELLNRIESRINEISTRTMHATLEESQKFPKFSKNTPRRIKRPDKMTKDDWTRVK